MPDEILTKAQLEKKYRIRLVKKTDSWVMRFIGLFSKKFRNYFWTTWRWPFQEYPVVYYPARIQNIGLYEHGLDHEKYHADFLRHWYGPPCVVLFSTILPLPMYISGRWFLERDAYLNDIIHQRRTLEMVVVELDTRYGHPWPKSWMRAWFQKGVAAYQLKKRRR